MMIFWGGNYTFFPTQNIGGPLPPPPPKPMLEKETLFYEASFSNHKNPDTMRENVFEILLAYHSF